MAQHKADMTARAFNAPFRRMNGLGPIGARLIRAYRFRGARNDANPSLRGAKRRRNPFFLTVWDGLLRGVYHWARIRATGWLAMTLTNGLLRGACHRAGIRPTRWLAMMRGKARN